jgi:hypothetical protein
MNPGDLRLASKGQLSLRMKVYSLISNSNSGSLSQASAFMAEAGCGKPCRKKKGRLMAFAILVRSARCTSVNAAFGQALDMPVEL